MGGWVGGWVGGRLTEIRSSWKKAETAKTATLAVILDAPERSKGK